MKLNKFGSLCLKYRRRELIVLLEVKCFVGEQRIDREDMKKIIVDDKVINRIVAQVNNRGEIKEQYNG